MGYAIVAGGVASLALHHGAVVVAEPNAARHAAFPALGSNIHVVASAKEALARLAEYERTDGPGQILLAVKPQMLGAVAGEIGNLVADRVVVTILAGTPGAKVRAALGGRCRVMRAMPNFPAKIGRGTTAVCLSAGARPGDDAFARRLFTGIGRLVVTIDESMMDAFTAVAGSGPAYVFYLAEAMVRAAVELGFDEKTATDMVRETVAGAGAMLGEAFETPGELRKAVTSKGGTTEAAIGVLERERTGDAMVRAVRAAEVRGKELGA